MFPINSINYSNAMGMHFVHWETCSSAIASFWGHMFIQRL